MFTVPNILAISENNDASLIHGQANQLMVRQLNWTTSYIKRVLHC